MIAGNCGASTLAALLEVLAEWPVDMCWQLQESPEWAQALRWGWIMRSGELTGAGLSHVHALPVGSCWAKDNLLDSPPDGWCSTLKRRVARAMRPDLIAVDESRIAADAELTRVLEPGMPGVDKRTVQAKWGISRLPKLEINALLFMKPVSCSFPPARGWLIWIPCMASSPEEPGSEPDVLR